MKANHFHLLVLLLLPSFLFSQSTYQWQNPLPQGANLQGEYFINSQKGWMVGDAGLIMMTPDGGESWEIQNSGSMSVLRDAFFINENEGWVVGNSETILHTTNGGSTWTQQDAPTIFDLFSVSFINADTGWIFGTYMTVLRTFNGGQTWNLMSTGSPSADWLTEGIFTDFNHGWAVGGELYMSYGTIYKSIDGGQNWDTVLFTSNYLKSISFPCMDTGYVCGSDGVFLKTTDGGQTWNDVLTGFPNSFSHVSFNSELKGYAISLSSYNNVIHTVDGGMTWTPLSVGPAFCGLQKIISLNDTISFLNGNNGLMMKTNDGGLSWTELCMGSHATFYDIFFQDQLNGWAAGFGYPSSVAHTTNGGASWEELTNPLYIVGPIRSICFGDMNNGLMVGDFGPFLKTTDGGLNWDTIHNPSNVILNKIRYFDPDHLITIGYQGKIMLSSDGGLTWNSSQTGCTSALSDICIIDSLQAWVVGYSEPVILKTNDKGATWNIINTGFNSDYKSVSFINSLQGWISGTGIVLHTMDGGLSWESYPVIESGTLLGIHFFDPLNGSGFNHSYRYFTTDGGQTWDKETIPYNRWINAVWYKDQHSAWLAGQGGTVLLWSDTVNVSLPNPPVPTGKFSVFPNPASKFIRISCDQLGEENFPALFKLIDLLGNTVLNINLISKQQCNHIKLPQSSDGLYIGILETRDKQKYFIKIYIKN